MLPRSLQNFMNAMTSSDHTTYPFATTNAQDFKNLMSVYLDATLHPLLKRSDFVQEGWRIGPENPLKESDEQGTKDLVFKGVVYNEMKGQVSDATYLFYIKFFEQIIPALNNSGGDPQKMTDLTYEQLQRFQNEHYHPSNSRIVTYGDQSVETHLQMLGEQLAKFDKVNIDKDIKGPIALKGPQTVTIPGPVDPLVPPESQFKTSTTWVTGDPSNVDESFALQVISNILLDGYGAPLYRSLVESGLGTDFSPNTGYDSSASKGLFSIGLTGVSEKNVPRVKEAISDTLLEQAANGFEKHKVDGLLHVLELKLKHKSSRFGLGVAQSVTGSWFNGVDPFASLDYEHTISTFRKNMQKSRYLEKLVEKYLLTDNTLTFTMAPSATFGAELEEEEAARLQTKIAEAVKQFPNEQEAHKHLRERELELLKEQDSGKSANVDVLPTLRVSDIERTGQQYEARESQLDEKTNVKWRETATNGLTYVKALAMFKDLPDELRMLVPLFCDSLMRIGTKDKSMEELEGLMKLKTGGIRFGYHATTSPHDILKAEEGLSLGGYAFDKNVPAMYELINTILLGTDFDSPNAHGMIKELLRAGADGAVDGIASAGHMYASRYSKAGLSLHGAWGEQTGGLRQVKLITSLASAEEDANAMALLVERLKAIQAIVVESMRTSFRAMVTCGADASGSNEAALQSFITTTRSSPLTPPAPLTTTPPPTYPTLNQKTLFPFPTYQVSYTALTLPTGPYTSQQTAPFAILAQLLTHKHLHHEIREKGGAYGGGASSSGLTGTFGMYSYRDHNPANTLRIMREAGRWAAEREWSERELEEAKLSCFQGLDAPISVNQEGVDGFLLGIDAQMDQQRREWLLDVDARQVRQAAEEVAKALEGNGANVAVLGNDKGGFVKEGEGWEVRDMGIGK
ncbi:Mitochondrial presequence protease [Recurvomyces mirabilis]|uniref:Presequence protease, mitochondrial n=1 Tax=Recurvomyces mirabilis TaxID=574656 RepID=A0AAE0WU26_9PEZI|nr:Mitochondrial presequence protease [Recurvomyces mirabilis]KAK5157563.1 Mitochondrial presequence protease [Recurvomyces mirabilis]